MVAISTDELKAILQVPERLRPERIASLRNLCAGVEIGYANVGKWHYFFLAGEIGARSFERGELGRFIETTDDFEAVYGSKKADELYESRTYRGVFATGLEPKKKRVSKRKK
jgi:hypothetical protein